MVFWCLAAVKVLLEMGRGSARPTLGTVLTVNPGPSLPPVLRSECSILNFKGI